MSLYSRGVYQDLDKNINVLDEFSKFVKAKKIRCWHSSTQFRMGALQNQHFFLISLGSRGVRQDLDKSIDALDKYLEFVKVCLGHQLRVNGYVIASSSP